MACSTSLSPKALHHPKLFQLWICCSPLLIWALAHVVLSRWRLSARLCVLA